MGRGPAISGAPRHATSTIPARHGPQPKSSAEDINTESGGQAAGTPERHEGRESHAEATDGLAIA